MWLTEQLFLYTDPEMWVLAAKQGAGVPFAIGLALFLVFCLVRRRGDLFVICYGIACAFWPLWRPWSDDPDRAFPVSKFVLAAWPIGTMVAVFLVWLARHALKRSRPGVGDT